MKIVKDRGQTLKSGASLHLLSQSELELMQSITRRQMKSESDQSVLFLLDRVWNRLEQENMRRKADVRELERIYFMRAPSGKQA